MSAIIGSIPCQANHNGRICDKDARAKCFHCSLDLCLQHLTEHTQLIDKQVRSGFYPYENALQDLSKKFEAMSIPLRIVELPFNQLEKWRLDAHSRLDQLAEQKREEIRQKISEYEIQFRKKTNEEKHKLNLLMKRFNDLSRQTNQSNKDIKYLEEKINEIKSFMESIDKHSIKISIHESSINIKTNFFEPQTTTNHAKNIQSTNSTRNSRPEKKELLISSSKQRFDKKRSLSVSLL